MTDIKQWQILEWLQRLLVWAFKTLNMFEMDFLHLGHEAIEKGNFLIPGFFIFLQSSVTEMSLISLPTWIKEQVQS